MHNKFTIDVNNLKLQMNPIFKIIFVYPLEILIYIINYLYIAILTTYFKLGVNPDIVIETANFKTNISIKYTCINSDFEDSDNESISDNSKLD
jgi:hypothetical protein